MGSANDARPRFETWGRTASCNPADIVFPASEADVARTVRAAGERGTTVKPVGGGHSWSDVACTDGVQLSLDRMNRVLAVDRATGEVRVEAGMRLRELNERLAECGLAMRVLGSIAEQSVAGAISTGTHGSAPRVGVLASLVTALRMVRADGAVVTASARENPDLFDAARVGLGALGVITEVTLACLPAFTLREEARPVPFERALESLPELLAREEFVKLWWMPHTDTVMVYRYERCEDPWTFSARGRWFDERVVNRYLFAGVLAAGRYATRAIPALNRVVGASYFRPATRTGRSDHLLNIAMPPVHDECEFAIPVEHTADALRWLRGMIAREGLRVNFVVEARFVAGDSAWMSPSYGRDSCYLGAYMARSRGITRYFRAFEARMLEMGGRPHWGKTFRADADALRRVHPRYDAFRALRDELDPRGVFANAFLGRVFGEGARTEAVHP